ncbi:LIVCS family branched-chain amino acid:cation transporter [Oikeobacillus pervagus]|uniref:Branched-chain amino acid transport system carrier protein n=1 Tax=Oikeobacillus pervagus TaxID=1325931 RepID=A0AAJ1SXF7_9BACI|nr:branched-chain amino acid transport system II carrier protein [Oikeobacillus pervagus]MDQ0214334.1 LIVCS family branched-chain amino acid:cation transporter [Oikeobacillus pervagus]
MNKKDIFFIGLMLFALFFGAGNLIFPPFLGMEAGESLWPAILGFIVTGIGLPILSVTAVALMDNGVRSIGDNVHPIFGIFFAVIIYFAIGPFFGIPRGANVAYEMAIAPFLTSTTQPYSLFIFTTLFFAIVFWLSLNPSRMVDRIGQLLTPILLVAIAILCVSGILQLNHPLQPATEKYANAPFFKGFMEGYLTMDTIAALAFGIVVVSAFKLRGVQEKTVMLRSTVQAGLIAGIGLSLVYISTAIVGAKMATVGTFTNGGDLLSSAANQLFGSGGKLLLGVIVALACLTTCIGLTAACAQFFTEIMPKISYRIYALMITIFSFLVANLGLNQIISISAPVLAMIYPLAIVLIFMSFFHRFYMGSRKVYGGALLFTALFSLYDGLTAFGVQTDWLQSTLSWVPFFSVGLGWVIPALMGGVIGWGIDRIIGLTDPQYRSL